MAFENKGHVKLKSHKTNNIKQEIPGLADWIIQNSTTEELLKLTEYPNSVVKLQLTKV